MTYNRFLGLRNLLGPASAPGETLPQALADYSTSECLIYVGSDGIIASSEIKKHMIYGDV